MCFTQAWLESGCPNSAAIMAVAGAGDEPKGAGSGTIISTGRSVLGTEFSHRIFMLY